MFSTSHTLFRPPGEADSLIIRIADGCPWNGCTFCGMYKGVPYRFKGLDHAKKTITGAQTEWPNARRIFLADGDVMHLKFPELEQILLFLNERFPRLARVGVYANGASILSKSDSQLRRLRNLKLHTLYMGLESGDDQTLTIINKKEDCEKMVEAGIRAQSAGFRMSVMVLIGLAGKVRSMDHARATAEALNRMQPRLLSALRLVTTPNTPLYKNGFKMITEQDAVAEMAELIRHLELTSTVFRADHSSNVVPLEARFPKDKQRLIADLETLLDSGQLDSATPGRPPFSL